MSWAAQKQGKKSEAGGETWHGSRKGPETINANRNGKARHMGRKERGWREEGREPGWYQISQHERREGGNGRYRQGGRTQ
eukprot:1504486-Pleurochrysis_carterae.AAC.1